MKNAPDWDSLPTTIWARTRRLNMYGEGRVTGLYKSLHGVKNLAWDKDGDMWEGTIVWEKVEA